MTSAARAHSARFRSVADVMRHRGLRRLQLGWAAFFLVDGTSMVALSVWAFDEGGAASVGFIGLARLLPGALTLPFGAWAADRFPRRRVVGAVFAAMCAVQTSLAVALVLDASHLVVFALVTVSSVVTTPYRPAQLALVPLVARSPQELVAANVTSGVLEGLATFVGPTVAATLLITSNAAVVIGMAAVAAGAGLWAVSGIEVGVDPSKTGRKPSARPIEVLFGGFAELRSNIDMSIIVGCFVAQLLVRGVLGVLLVSVSYELLGIDGSGVGWLAAAIGVGGLIGSLFSVELTGRRRLGRPFAIALVLWGLPIAVVGLVPNTGVAVGALLTLGAGNAILDVSGFTIIQRLGADRTLGRVFGVLFTVGIAIGGLGALATPAVVSAFGLRPTLIVVGLLLPVLALALLPRFRSLDERSEPVPELMQLLAHIPLLAPLPPTSLEKIAKRCAIADLPAGQVILAEGEEGNTFYAIVTGHARVMIAGVQQRTLGPGDHFGEIALIRNVARTATVAATSDVQLITIGREDFLDAVTSSDVASTVAWRSIEQLLSDGAHASSD